METAPSEAFEGAAEEIVEVDIDEKELVGILNAPNKDANTMNADENVKLIDDKDTAPLNNKTIKITGKERKKSNFENFRDIYSSNTLKNYEIIKNTLRSWNFPSLVNSSSVYNCVPPISGLDLKSNNQEVIGVGDESSLLEGVVLNENNPVLLL